MEQLPADSDISALCQRLGIAPAAATVDIETAARIVGVGRTVGYQLAREGRFPGVIKVGKKYRVSVFALAGELGVQVGSSGVA